MKSSLRKVHEYVSIVFNSYLMLVYIGKRPVSVMLTYDGNGTGCFLLPCRVT